MRSFLTFVLLVIFCWNPAVAAVQDPARMVEEVSQEVLHVIRSEKQDFDAHPARLYALIEDVVVPRFDFERMTRWALGRYWKRAGKLQQSILVLEFKTLLVRTYAMALLEYSDAPMQYLPSGWDGEVEQATVRVLVEQESGTPVPVHYRLRLKNDTWKVFDFAVDGVSLVAAYRTSFASQIQQLGLQGFIEELERINRQHAQ